MTPAADGLPRYRIARDAAVICTIAGVLALIIFPYEVDHVPITGRKHYLAVSAELEKKIGIPSFLASIQDHNVLPADHAAVCRLNSIVEYAEVMPRCFAY